MAHRYGQLITVVEQVTAGQPPQPPRAFAWRGAVYRVVDVLRIWHLRDRWWQTDGSAALGMAGASDRTYYQVRCAPSLLCEIYHDAATGAWVLDRVCD